MYDECLACLCMYVCAPHVCLLSRGARRGCQSPCTRSYWKLWATLWVLEAEPRSSAKAEVFECWVPSPVCLFYPNTHLHVDATFNTGSQHPKPLKLHIPPLQNLPHGLWLWPQNPPLQFNSTMTPLLLSFKQKSLGNQVSTCTLLESEMLPCIEPSLLTLSCGINS